MTDRFNIILIEDNLNLRSSWETVINFEQNMNVGHSFESVEEALRHDSISTADVVLLDIDLNGMSGVDGVKEILKRFPSTTIIMATVHEDNDHIFQALENGAVGYLSKKVSTSELIDAINDVMNGGSPMSPSVARKVITSFQGQSEKNKKYPALSERETEILQLLADGKSYASIAKTIFLSVDGVGYHVRHIYEKLQVNSRGEAVKEGMKRKLIKLFS